MEKCSWQGDQQKKKKENIIINSMKIAQFQISKHKLRIKLLVAAEGNWKHATKKKQHQSVRIHINKFIEEVLQEYIRERTTTKIE